MKKLLTAAAAAGLLISFASAGMAQGNGVGIGAKGSTGADVSASTPGHQMQQKGSVKGTTGASGYAPGHATTGAGVNAGAKAGGINAGVGASGNAGVNEGGKSR